MNRLLRASSDAVTSRLFRSVEVAAAEDHGPSFRTVRLSA
jgi:hypothetical protein